MKRTTRHALVVLSASILLAIVSCRPKKAAPLPEHRLAETIRLGEVALKVVDHGYRQVFLVRDGSLPYLDPLVIYAIRVSLTNRGNLWVSYQPGHNRTRVSGADYPILRDDRKRPVPHLVYTDGVHPLAQVVGTRSLGPGEHIEDVYYFKAPDTSVRELVLRIPAWFEAKSAVLVRFPVSHKPVRSPRLVPKSESVRLDGLEIRVAGVRALLPQRVEHGRLGRATKPVLAVTIDVRNRGRRSVPYRRFSDAQWSPTLWSGGKLVGRVELDGERRKQRRAGRIGAGQHVGERLLFVLPTTADSLELLLPLIGLGRRAIVRFDLGTPASLPKN